MRAFIRKMERNRKICFYFYFLNVFQSWGSAIILGAPQAAPGHAWPIVAGLTGLVLKWEAQGLISGTAWFPPHHWQQPWNIEVGVV